MGWNWKIIVEKETHLLKDGTSITSPNVFEQMFRRCGLLLFPTCVQNFQFR